MTRLTALAFTAALTMALLPGAGGAVTVGSLPPITTHVVNNGPGNQTDPQISGSLVSYTNDATASGSEIRYHDVVSGLDRAVPALAGEFDFLSDISGTTVVFTRIDVTENAIYAFDTSGTQQPFELAPENGPSFRLAPAIGGRTVAFQDFSFTGLMTEPEIVVAAVDGGAPIRLTHDALLDRNLAVSPDGSAVVWTKCNTDDTGCDVWGARQMDAWTATNLTSSPAEERTADTNGSLVVYTATEAGETDIFWRPVAGGAATRLALPGFQSNPNVSRDVISFETASLPGGSRDVYVYDRTQDTLYQVTKTTADESLSDISVSPSGLVRVVYNVPEGGNFNVYAYEFQLPGSSPADLLAQLIQLVESFNLRQGIENSLDAKLANAKQALERANAGDTATACSLLDAFLNELAAQAGNALTVDQASQLTQKASAVKAALGCT
jgi:Tol biopolymer transport system component